jgi:hypothetical protein
VPNVKKTVLARSDQEWNDALRLTWELWALGYPRPSEPELKSTSKEITGVQAQLDAYASAREPHPLDALSAADRQTVHQAFVSTERDAGMRAQKISDDKAGVYRTQCVDFGYGGFEAYSAAFSPWNFDFQSQFIIIPKSSTYEIAMRGRTNFVQFPVVNSSQVYRVKDGIQQRVEEVTLRNPDSSQFHIQFFPAGARLMFSDGSRQELRKCPIS